MPLRELYKDLIMPTEQLTPYNPIWFLAQSMKLCQQRGYKTNWVWVTFKVFYSRWNSKVERKLAEEYLELNPAFEYDEFFLKCIEFNHTNPGKVHELPSSCSDNSL